jgi:hypothetical protein
VVPEIGMPKPIGPSIPEILIQEFGDFRNSDGAQLLLHGNLLVVQARMGGHEMYLATEIEEVLEAIQTLTRQVGS